MRTRQLGRDGPEVSVLGFGAWKAGGSWIYGLGEVDDSESIATIRRAIDGGVNWVDTAPIYGGGAPRRWWAARSRVVTTFW